MSALTRRPRTYAIAFGVACFLFQVAFLLANSPAGDLYSKWGSFLQWDTIWYAHIVDNGYSLSGIHPDQPLQWSVAFFPALPILAKAVAWIFSLEAREAVLAAGQACSLAFWIFLQLCFAKWEWRWPLRLLGSVLLLSLPGAYYFAVGYTEPVLLASFFVFLYYADSLHARVGFAASAIAGFILTISRLVGMPLAFFVRLPSYVEKIFPRAPTSEPTSRRLRDALFSRETAVLAISYLGFFGWLLYLQLDLGDWRVFATTNCKGWSVCSDFSWVFSKRAWTPDWRFFGPWNFGDINGQNLGAWITPWTVWLNALGLVVALRDWRDERNALWLCAQPLLWIPIVSFFGSWINPQVRYQSLALAFLVVYFLRKIERRPRAQIGVAIASLPLVASFFYVQARLVWMFASAWWVAVR